MTIKAGTTLGHYKIAAAIGAGGMGEVYRAQDSKLNRDVAIKVLPEAFARDSDRLGRFRREAQVLAALNHPNIAAIYGLEESDGIHALVMELVEGPTLEDRIAAGPIPVDEALAIAMQIVAALEIAHGRGIIHRDLKPANIKVTPDDKVKVLDFGLAKMGTDETDAADLSQSPTMIQGTQAGIILGTAAYMSPEQARGRAVDKRSDLWAFGVVLMEMLTGKRLFTGDTATDVIAAVLTQNVDWTVLPDTTPAPIRRLLRRCLEKDRRRRLPDAASATLEIDDALAGASDDRAIGTATRPAPRAPRWTALRVVLPTVLLTALVAGLAARSLQRRAPAVAPRPFMLTIVPPEGVHLPPVGTINSPPHISPDGSAVLFKNDVDRGLYVRRLDALELLQVPGGTPTTNEPFWRGSAAVSFFVSQQQLLSVRLPDGAPETVMPVDGYTRSGSWSDAGTVLVSVLSHLMARHADGTAALVAIPGNRIGELVYPEFLPGSEDFLALFKPDGGDGEVWLATLGKDAVTKPTILFKNDTAASYTSWDGGCVLFVKNDNLYSQHLNRTSRAVEGSPELVVRSVASQPGLFRADFSVAGNGAVAWRPGRAALAQVMVFDRRGAAVGPAGPAGPIESVIVSPADDSRLFVRGTDGWLVDVGQSGRVLLPGDAQWMNWTPDGRKVMGLVGENRIVTRLADSVGGIDSIGQFPPGSWDPRVISPDGQFVLARNVRSGGGSIWARLSDMATAGSWTPLVGSDEAHADLSFSPDGRFVLYNVFGSGGGIYVQPFPGPGRRQLIDQSGIDPVWRGDGAEILFTRSGAVWSVAVARSGGSLTFGTPQRLFEGVRRAPSAVNQSRGLSVSHDGERIFLVQGVEQPEANLIHVMTRVAQRAH